MVWRQTEEYEAWTHATLDACKPKVYGEDILLIQQQWSEVGTPGTSPVKSNALIRKSTLFDTRFSSHIGGEIDANIRKVHWYYISYSLHDRHSVWESILRRWLDSARMVAVKKTSTWKQYLCVSQTIDSSTTIHTCFIVIDGQIEVYWYGMYRGRLTVTNTPLLYVRSGILDGHRRGTKGRNTGRSRKLRRLSKDSNSDCNEKNCANSKTALGMHARQITLNDADHQLCRKVRHTERKREERVRANTNKGQPRSQRRECKMRGMDWAQEGWLNDLTCKMRTITGDEKWKPNVKGRRERLAGGKGEAPKDKQNEKEYSLYAQYVSRVEQLPREVKSDLREYRPLLRPEFDKWSRKRQILELQKLGLAVDSADEAHKLFIRWDEVQYPQTHTELALPKINVKHVKTAELLHHKYHITDKIKRLYKKLSELKREARIVLRCRRKDMATIQEGRFLSQGVSRTKHIYDVNMSIKKHCSLLMMIESQMKSRFKTFRMDTRPVYIDDEAEPIKLDSIHSVVPKVVREHKGKPRCRHHVRKVNLKRPDSPVAHAVKEPSDAHLSQRAEVQKWANITSNVLYHKGVDRVGDFLTDSKDASLLANHIKTGTLNINGLDDVKLELVLQFFQEEELDVLFLIDARLDKKNGKYMGKKVKQRLGLGSRTHTNPCILDYHTDGTKGFRKVGGIFTIVSPKWGTSVTTFQDDKFGPNDTAAGVMTQLIVHSKRGSLNIIGAYWPNKHSPNDTSEQNLWKCLNRYVLQHRQRDKSPTELMQRTAGVWTQTAAKNGVKGTLLCGDLNATWTGNEPGGQSVIERWASELSFHNGIRRIANKHKLFMYTRGDESQPKSWIDHVLHKGSKTHIDIVAGYTSRSELWEGITDHRPIWGIYDVGEPAQKTPKSAELSKVRWELRLTDRSKCDDYVEAMETFHSKANAPTAHSSMEEIFEYLNKLQSTMSQTVRGLYQHAGQTSIRSSHKDGWSPTYIAYKSHLTALVRIRRHITGQKGRRKWTNAKMMQDDLGDIIHEWNNALASIDVGESQMNVIATCVERSKLWWSSIQTIPQYEKIDEDITKIKHLLHGAQRHEFRRRINSAVRRREDNRRGMKWRKVLGSILGTLGGRKHQEGVDLNLLETKTGEIMGNPEDCHKAITDNFRDEWFAKPDWCKGALHDTKNEHGWTRSLASEEHFMRDTEYTKVPANLRQLIHKAIVAVPKRQRINGQLQQTLQSAPSLLDFEEAIRKSHANSSAGMNGVSYNMLKRLPAEVVKNLHYCLTRIWETKATPDWWTRRWLVPIPKGSQEITNIGNLRPLILVDAVRKLWCKLLLQRILQAWKEHDVMQHTQHGFIGGKSTMTASFLFINMLEDAIENDSPLQVCSWDITRAFDSVSKQIMKLAWTRLGVPEEWVEWLVAMDAAGMTVVRTPQAIKIWDKFGNEGFRNTKAKQGGRNVRDMEHVEGEAADEWEEVEELGTIQEAVEGFTAVRGTGQGDVTSPACWGAVFDILLTALTIDAEERKGRWAQGRANLGYAVTETAYADDLLSYAQTPAELQRKANVVSAFCAIMGLQLSTSKLRRFVLVNSGLEEEAKHANTIVHTYGWAESEVKTQQEGVLEYLGGKRDSTGESKAALQEIKDIAVSHCAETGICAASATTKIGVIDISTYPKIRYKSKLMSATLSELQSVDKIFYKFHCKATKQMAGFPYDLMYLNAQRGGGGLKKFSDLSGLDKLAEVYRGLGRKDEVEMAVQGLLQRVLRMNKEDLHGNFKACYRHKKGARHWMRSLLEWLEYHNLYLWRGGAKPNQTNLSCPISKAYPDLATTIIGRLHSKRLIHIGDLIDDRAGIRRWNVPETEKDLKLLLPIDPPTDKEMILWPGQFWKPCVTLPNLGMSTVIEVLHIDEKEMVHVAKWVLSDRSKTQEWYRRAEGTHIFTHDVLFPSAAHCCRVDQGGWIKGRNRCIFKNYRDTPRPQVNPTCPEQMPGWVEAANKFCAKQGPGYKPRIYTDGMYREEDFDLHAVFDSTAVARKSGASLVIIHDGPEWKTRPIYAMCIKDGDLIDTRSAYTMEYLALAAALRIQQDFKATATCSDSLAVVKVVQKRFEHLKKADATHRVMLQSMETAIQTGAKCPQWVPSHVERRNKKKSTWTKDEWGNYLADKVADKERRLIENEFQDVQWIEVPALRILKDIPQKGEIYIGDFRGMPTAINGVMDHIHQIRFDRYLIHRDANRVGEARWHDNTIGMAAEVYNGKMRNVGRYAHTARILYDKHWDGRNRSKNPRLVEGHDDAARCHMCGGGDSQAHAFRWCTHSNISAIRQEVTAALQEYLKGLQAVIREKVTPRENMQHVQLVQGVVHEFHNCIDASRVWTGNWSADMIMRMQHRLGMDRMTKKQCGALRKTLLEVYEIISQGACDILEVRHSFSEIQRLHEAREQSKATSYGQGSIKDWLVDSQGVSGKTRRLNVIEEQRRLDDFMKDEEDFNLDDEAARLWDSVEGGDTVEVIQQRWIPKISIEALQQLQESLTDITSPNRIMTTIENKAIRAGSLCKLIEQREVMNDIMDGYGRLLQKRNTTRHCKVLSSSFFENLYNPTGKAKQSPRETLNLKKGSCIYHRD